MRWVLSSKQRNEEATQNTGFTNRVIFEEETAASQIKWKVRLLHQVV